jgi:prolyl-tRNA synthetase
VGKKTDSETFAGALATFSIEHLMPDGRAIQGPDFHSDGQNFAKAFELTFVDQKGEKQLVWQNTFAITTREIGVMVATHSDDKGLVLPPRVAPIQVVVVPIFNDDTKEMVLTEAKALADSLAASFSTKLDDRDYLTPGRKFNEWELRGVPLRVEIGPRDIKQGLLVLARRDTSQKRSVKRSEALTEVSNELDAIQDALYKKALDSLNSRVSAASTYDELKEKLSTVGGIVRAPWCGSRECEAKAKEETGAKIINMTLDQGPIEATCVLCGSPASVVANFAKSY